MFGGLCLSDKAAKSRISISIKTIYGIANENIRSKEKAITREES
jgi:hypothetical protein